MDITVTITTVNRANRLIKIFEALLAQVSSTISFEVIVSDNGSIDHTKKVCDNFSSKFENFSYIYDPRPGQLVGWHRALEVSQGEVCCFIDDDVNPGKTWLAAIKDVYQDPNVGLATGPIKLIFEKEPPDWIRFMVIGEPGEQTLPAFGLLDCGSNIREIPANFVWGTNFTVRKSCLLSVNGFHPCAMPGHLLKFYGDGEIYAGRSVEMLGHKVLYHPEISVVHHIPIERLTFKSIESKFFTSGCARSFAELRRLRQPYELPKIDEFKDLALRYFPDSDRTPDELIEVVQNGLTAGISSHLKSFTDDADFREWVLHDNYLDLNQCYIHSELLKEYPRKNIVDWRFGG
jgi:glycosyltransferase involved in cell wall biosynthesis